MSDSCLHQKNHLYFPDTGHKWYVCDNCGTFLQESELALYTRISALEAKNMEIAQHDCAQVLANDRLLLRISALEKVAEAAAEVHKYVFGNELRVALRAAGYLGEGNE